VARSGQSQQRGAKRSDRLVQARESYRVKLPEIVSGRDILLVDDVLTTGATICEVARTLRKAGARNVDALIFAKRL
jgi:predicted amidophosphoribosyltransferase